MVKVAAELVVDMVEEEMVEEEVKVVGAVEEKV